MIALTVGDDCGTFLLNKSIVETRSFVIRGPAGAVCCEPRDVDIQRPAYDTSARVEKALACRFLAP